MPQREQRSKQSRNAALRSLALSQRIILPSLWMIGPDNRGTSANLSPNIRTTDKLSKKLSKKVKTLSSGIYSLIHHAFNHLGHPRFFLGSDSAPHPPHAKSTSSPTHACAAGVYTSPILLPLVAHLLESFGALDKLENFTSVNGRSFYKFPVEDQKYSRTVFLRKTTPGTLVDTKYVLGTESLVPFWAGKEIGWEIYDNTAD